PQRAARVRGRHGEYRTAHRAHRCHRAGYRPAPPLDSPTWYHDGESYESVCAGFTGGCRAAVRGCARVRGGRVSVVLIVIPPADTLPANTPRFLPVFLRFLRHA